MMFSKREEATGQTLQDYAYSYKPSGNIESIIKRDGRATDGTTSYGYDALYRLKTVSGPESTEDYTYDPLGNRRTSLGVTGSWVYNANNELLSYGSTTIQYDLNGNTTQKTGPDGVVWTYLWDLENRLTEVKKGGVLVATYLYDPFGRRLTKTVYENGTPRTTHFAYADEGLVAEYDATGTVTKAYGYYPNSTWTTNPLYMWTAEEVPTGGYYWYLNDHLGTPKALTDELGQLVWSATSEAFGETSVAPGSAITNNLRFPGQYEDGESGENYNFSRYYDKNASRYISIDPIRMGHNYYSYSEDDPIMGYDPLGLKTDYSFIMASLQIFAGLVAGGGTAKTDCNGGRKYTASYFIVGGSLGIAANVGLKSSNTENYKFTTNEHEPREYIILFAATGPYARAVGWGLSAAEAIADVFGGNTVSAKIPNGSFPAPGIGAGIFDTSAVVMHRYALNEIACENTCPSTP